MPVNLSIIRLASTVLNIVPDAILRLLRLLDQLSCVSAPPIKVPDSISINPLEPICQVNVAEGPAVTRVPLPIFCNVPLPLIDELAVLKL